MDTRIQDLISQFTRDLTALIEEKVRKTVMDAVGASTAAAAAAPEAPEKKSDGHQVPPGRQLWGRYIGRLRHLKGRNRQRVIATKRRLGVAEAIKLADRLS